MKRRLIIAVSALAISTAHAAVHGGNTSAGAPPPPTWQFSYTPGNLDQNSVFMGGTEMREFALYNGKLYLGIGYWLDSPGAEGAQNGQVLELDCQQPACQWKVNHTFPTNMAVSALQTISFTIDNAGVTLSPPTTLLINGTWWQGGHATCGATNYPIVENDLNPNDNVWYQNIIDCGSNANGDPQIRGFGTHIDLQVTPNADYVFAGDGPTGIVAGQLKHGQGAGASMIAWAANDEFLLPPFGSLTPTCTAQYRFTSVIEATGADGVRRAYGTACFNQYVRIDGPSPGTHSCNAQQVDIGTGCVARWQVYFVEPYTGAQSASGFRGLTELGAEPSSGGGTTMLVGQEGAVSVILKIPPLGSSLSGSTCGTTGNVACVPCATISGGVVTPTGTPANCVTKEFDVIANDTSLWGFTALSTIAPYNTITPYTDRSGVLHQLIGFSSFLQATNHTLPSGFTFQYIQLSSSGNPIDNFIGGAYYWQRTPGSPPTYQQFQVGVQGATPFAAIRTIVQSPFSTNPSGLYFGFYDGQNAVIGQSYYWCTVSGTCTVPPVTSFLPTHNTGYVAYYGP